MPSTIVGRQLQQIRRDGNHNDDKHSVKACLEYILGAFCGFIIVGVPIGLGIALWGQLPKNRTIKSIHDMNIRPLLLHQSPLLASVVDNPNVFYTTATFVL